MTKPAPYDSSIKPKGWKFEIDLERVQQSDTWALACSAARPWLLMAWVTAWGQTPCGSLPSDEQVLCARLGISAKEFAKHKAILLRGWWLADDGRFYHDTIAEQVFSMIEKRKTEAERKNDYRLRKEAERAAANRDFLSETEAQSNRTAEMSHGTGSGQALESQGSATPVPPPVPPPVLEIPSGISLMARAPKKIEPAKAKASKRCPQDFQITPEMRQWAHSRGIAVDLDAETQKFLDHEYKFPKTDFVACWRTWMRNADEYATKSIARKRIESIGLSPQGSQTVQNLSRAKEKLFGRELQDAAV